MTTIDTSNECPYRQGVEPEIEAPESFFQSISSALKHRDRKCRSTSWFINCTNKRGLAELVNSIY